MLPPYVSTEGVFDLSLIQQQQNQRPSNGRQREELAAQDQGSTRATANDAAKGCLSRSASEESLPALDSLTMSSQAADDDSSVSTMGSTMSSSRRSVFSKYWSATGQAPPTTIGKRPDACSPATVVQPSRRFIFFPSNGSHNSLPGIVETQPLSKERKSVSVGDLSASGSLHRSRGPLQSCLRRDPIYSGERSSLNDLRRLISTSIHEEDDLGGDDSASICSSVRFDLDATDVRHFTLPAEVHAEDGWVGYFH